MLLKFLARINFEFQFWAVFTSYLHTKVNLFCSSTEERKTLDGATNLWMTFTTTQVKVLGSGMQHVTTT